MEVIGLELSEFTRRSRSVVLRHHAAGLGRRLEYGERVLLDTGAELRAAVVADIDVDLDDTQYRLVLGGVVPPELAEGRRTVDMDAAAVSGRVSVHDLADILVRAGAGQRIPMQRQAAERLLSDRDVSR
ncbi:MAG TPA: hypothetical protein VFE07_10660 [Marmoricola sp.]|nr:hypothetical protein [Marmoricola sp.]